jgi:hemerythrin
LSVKFLWEERYSVGNSNLDQQHQRLFRIGNEIQDASINEVKKYIMELYKYTREHFNCEEDHMKEIGFPDVKQHKEMHNALITKLNAIAEKGFGTDESFNEFKVFLYDWLINHILNQDRKYFDYYKNVKK